FGGTDRFAVVCRLGAGGMGVVYRAFDRERNAEVALKTLRDVDAQSLLRFKQEFRALADLSHPNLVRLGELVCRRGPRRFAMERVEGADLLAWVRPGTPATVDDDQISPDADTATRDFGAAPPSCDLARLRQVLPQLVEGISALHRAGKLHRDIKPSNVLVDQ